MFNTQHNFTYKNKMIKVNYIIFFIFYSLTIIFLDSFRNNIQNNFLIFWIVIMPVFICPFYNILKFRKGDNNALVLILIQIITVVFLLHFIRIFLTDYNVIFSDDGYAILDCAKYLLNNNYALSSTDLIYVKWFPAPILYDVISLLLNVDLVTTGVFLPALISTLGSIFIFLFTMAFIKDQRIALIAYLLLSGYAFYSITHSSAHPEFLAFIFMFISLFALFKTSHNKVIWTIIALFFVFLTVAANYTTSFFLMSFIIIVYIVNLFRIRRLNIRSKKVISVIFVIFAFTSFFTYAIYLGESAFTSSVIMVNELNMPSFRSDSVNQQVTIIPSIKDQISGKGQILIFLILYSFLIFGLYKYLNDREKFTKLVILSVWGFIGFSAYILTVILQFGGFYLGPRLLVFFMPFIFIGAAYIITDFKLYKRKLVIIFIISFFLVNISTFDFIPGNMVTTGDLPETYEGKPEISSIMWYQYSNSWVIGGDVIHTRGFNYYMGEYSTAYDYSPNNLNILRNYELVYQKSISKNPQKQTKIEEALNQFNNMIWLSEVYSNGFWQIYKIY